MIIALRGSRFEGQALDRGVTIDQALEDASATANVQLEVAQLESSGEFNKAIQILRTALSQTPESIGLLDEYLRVSRAAGDLREAYDLLLTKTTTNNVSLSMHLLLAETGFALEEYEQALIAAQHVVELNPNQKNALKILADISRLRRHVTKRDSLEWFQLGQENKVIHKDQTTQVRLEIPVDFAQDLELARGELRHGRLHVAEQRYTRLLSQRPSDSAILNELMELFCQRIEQHEKDMPDGPVNSALLDRFLAQLEVPRRYELLSSEILLRIAETMARVNRVAAALESLGAALCHLDLTAEILRDFTTKLLQPEVADGSVIPFGDRRALSMFLTQMGNGFEGTNDVYRAEACYHLAIASDSENSAARFNLAFVNIERGNILTALQCLAGSNCPTGEEVGLVTWPLQCRGGWPNCVFKHSKVFDSLKSADAPWPKITVVTRSTNQADYVEETLLSVLNQAYPDLELIVIDGATSDGTREILRQHGKRIKKLPHDRDHRQGEELNKALCLATGEIVLWVNSGDLLAPASLFMLALTLMEEGTDVIAGFHLEHNDRRFKFIRLPAVTQATFNVEFLGNLFGASLGRDYTSHCAVAFSRRILNKVGRKLDVNLTHAMGYEFWLRCAQAGGRLSVIPWPIALIRKPVPSTDSAECVREKSVVRDRFVLPEPTLSRKLEVRQRVAWAFAKPNPEIAVVSTQVSSIFSPDTARELEEKLAAEHLNISFHEDFTGVAESQADLVIMLVHLDDEQPTLVKLRDVGYRGPIVGWLWQNHNLLFANCEEAKDLDICIPGHAFATSYLRSNRYLVGSPVPLCVTQWSGREASRFIKAHVNVQRSDVPYGNFVRHTAGTSRSAFVEQLESQGMEGVHLLEKYQLERYFMMPPEERFKIWAGHKVSICLPQRGEIAQRVFDALLTGQIPIMPSDIPDLDRVIPQRFQKSLPVVRIREYTHAAVQQARSTAIHLFNRDGQAGVLRRHRYALKNHMFSTRVIRIISEVRAMAGTINSCNPISLHKLVHSPRDGKESQRPFSVRQEVHGAVERNATVRRCVQETHCFSSTQPVLAKKQNEAEINLFVPYYNCGVPRRQAEIDESLRKNIRCSTIDRIFLLIDDDTIPPVTHHKLSTIRIRERPTYKDWIELTRQIVRRGISVLANSDIFFDESVGMLKEAVKRRVFVALTRYEIEGDSSQKHPAPHWSQDVWAVSADQDFDALLLKRLDIPLGVPRCDNKVAYVFAIHGWSIINPVNFIRSYHFHESGFRSYEKTVDERVLGAVAYVHPSTSVDHASRIQVDIWALNSDLIEGVSINRSLDRWRERKVLKSDVEQWMNLPDEGDTQESRRRTQVPARVDTLARRKSNLIANGKLAFDFRERFKVYQLGRELLFYDTLTPHASRLVDVDGYLNSNGCLILDGRTLSAWLTPVLNVFPACLNTRESGSEDLNFWQYPCSTERQALENHADVQIEQCFDPNSRTFHVYLGLPWATYIDKAKTPKEVEECVGQKIRGLRDLIQHANYTLAVHTVCQHIHWRRLIDLWHSLCVTHLHLSHFDQIARIDCSASGFVGHSWPLIAVNVEVPERTQGLSSAKLAKERKYLASFIGAQMSHYRSDVRVRLSKLIDDSGRSDLFVKMTDQWHFNKIVYDSQVGGRTLGQADLESMAAATREYNTVLSDSVFSLCPEGAGPNTLRVWESLAVGAIPVIISDEWIPPRVSDLNIQLHDCAVFLRTSELQTLFDRLDAIDLPGREQRRIRCIRLYEAIRSLRTIPITP